MVVLVFGAASASAAPIERAYSPAYARCMKGSGGVTVSIRNCIGTEYERLDAELNSRYRALIASLPKQNGQSLRVAQRGWLTERKRVCDAAGRDEAGGTLELIMIDSCYLDRLYDRVATFKSMQRQ